MKFLKILAFLSLMFFIVLAVTNSCSSNNDDEKKYDKVVPKTDTTQKNVKTKDDIRYAELCDITMKHGVNFCYFYNELVRIEDESIKQADKVFNKNYPKEYYDYQDQLYQTGKRKLFRKYKIDESLVYEILVFGGVYCE